MALSEIIEVTRFNLVDIFIENVKIKQLKMLGKVLK